MAKNKRVKFRKTGPEPADEHGRRKMTEVDDMLKSAAQSPCSSTGSASPVAEGAISMALFMSGSGTAKTARPHPERNAPNALNAGPPIITLGAAACPPMTQTVPNVPLWPPSGRGGSLGRSAVMPIV